jgi:hypothetical protein
MEEEEKNETKYEFENKEEETEERPPIPWIRCTWNVIVAVVAYMTSTMLVCGIWMITQEYHAGIPLLFAGFTFTVFFYVWVFYTIFSCSRRCKTPKDLTAQPETELL